MKGNEILKGFFFRGLRLHLTKRCLILADCRINEAASSSLTKYKTIYTFIETTSPNIECVHLT